jgi:hypothetical protein
MSGDGHRTVLEAVEDRFYEEGQFSNAGDIVDWTGMSRSAVDDILDDLEGTGLSRVYDGNGKPTIYITKQMKNSLTSQVGEPDWIEDYEFEQKQAYRTEVEEANEKIAEYQVLERLLFGSGTPLEDSVAAAFERLGFDADETESDEDFLIEHDGHSIVIEVKGVGGEIKKKHVTQLGGWLDKKIDEGMDADELTGLLLHNHDRHTAPANRGEPLTHHAKQFLEIRNSIHVSTTELYELVRQVLEDDKSAGEARDEFLKMIL